MRWTPETIRELRDSYEESQEVFCRRLGVTIGTLRHWEQGRITPGSMAQLLLDRIKEDIINDDIRPLNLEAQHV